MADGTTSFWGPVTSSTEWCEKNYVYSSFIAEFYNTISNIPCILLALIGLINALRQRFEKRFSILHISNMILAIGSMLFHATLQNVTAIYLIAVEILFMASIDKIEGMCSSVLGLVVVKIVMCGTVGSIIVKISCFVWLCLCQQQSDETPMVWEMLLYIYILYSPDWHYRSTMPTFLFLYGAIFAIAHSQFRFIIGFKIHYVILCLLCIPRMYKYYIHTEDVSAKRVAKLYVATLFFASLFWVFDRFLCKHILEWPMNPQGHALWHILMGFNSYFANTFLMFCRSQQRGWSPKIVHFLGLLPYVKIQKPKSQ